MQGVDNKEYKIFVEKYEGPMDLLLDLIKKNEIDIYDIPIIKITQQFLEYIRSANRINMELTSDFILMASTLLEIKSKMLIPKVVENTEEEEDPREELVQKILEYEKFKNISEIFKNKFDFESRAFYKDKDLFIPSENKITLKDNDIKVISRVFKKFLLEKKLEEIITIEVDTFSVEMAIEKILEKLKKENEFNLLNFLREFNEKKEIITIFLAFLELVKLESIKAIQSVNYGDIKIVRR